MSRGDAILVFAAVLFYGVAFMLYRADRRRWRAQDRARHLEDLERWFDREYGP